MDCINNCFTFKFCNSKKKKKTNLVITIYINKLYLKLLFSKLFFEKFKKKIIYIYFKQIKLFERGWKIF